MGTIVLLLFPSGRRALCEDGGSTRVPNPECCGKPPAAPRGSRDTRGQPRRHSGLPPHIRTSQDGPACPGAGGTEGHQPRADPSTSAFSAAARPDGAPAGLWVAGGTAEARGCLFPIPGSPAAGAVLERSALLAPVEMPRCRSGRCGGGISLRFAS